MFLHGPPFEGVNISWILKVFGYSYLSRITLLHRAFGSLKKRHTHLKSSAKFLCNRFPTLRPLMGFGSSISFHGARAKGVLSGMPLHRNWRWSLFIFSITPFGTGKIDMKYRGRLDRDALMRVSRPPSDSNFPFHSASFFLILEMMGSQELILEVLPPIGRPKYVKGRVPILHRSLFAALLSHTSSVCNPTKELLWKLTCKPEARWNNTRTFLMLSRYSRLGGQKRIVSSAYWRWVIFKPPFSTSTPSHSFIAVAFWITRLRVSTMRSKRKGDKGSPCLRPRWSLTGGVGEPCMRIEAAAFMVHAFIQPFHRVGKPICRSVHSKKLQETLSKALWKSNFSIVVEIFFLLHVSFISPATKAPSRIWRPSTKDDWYGPIRESITVWSLLANIFAMIL